MKYNVRHSKQFKKDVRKLQRSGFDINNLKQVVYQLENDATLDKHLKDHALKGNLKGKRECHVAPDWLLLYEKDKRELRLLLLKTGSHKHVLGIE